MNNTLEYKITWVGLLVIKDRKVLMTKERGKDLFQLPGGGMEEGESTEDTLKREVKEELGLEIENPKLFEEAILPGRHEDVKIRFQIFTADVFGDIKPGEDIEEITFVDSQYEKNQIDVGNFAKMVLIPKLLEENLID